MKRYTLFFVVITFSMIGMEDDYTTSFEKAIKQLPTIKIGNNLSPEEQQAQIAMLERCCKEIQQLNQEHASTRTQNNSEHTQTSIEEDINPEEIHRPSSDIEQCFLATKKLREQIQTKEILRKTLNKKRRNLSKAKQRLKERPIEVLIAEIKL